MRKDERENSKSNKTNKAGKNKKHDGNIYDKIFKENVKDVFIPLVEQELGIKIKSYQLLQEKYQSTLEREFDFLYKVVTEDKQRFLLHIEFQTKLNSEMLYRMVEYHGLILKKHKMPIKHLVIYLGRRKKRLRTQLKDNEVFRGYDLIQLHEIDTEKLLSSQVPEMVLLAVLSNFPKEQTESVLRLIIRELKRISTDRDNLGKYLKQLTIFSRLRNLDEETSKMISTMSLHYDIEKDYLYNLGIKKQKEISKKELEAERKEAKRIQEELVQKLKEQEQNVEGELREQQEQNITNLLKLGTLSQKQIAESLNVTPYLVRKVKKRMES